MGSGLRVQRPSPSVSSVKVVTRSAVPADTDAEVYALLVNRWRSMTVAERLTQADQLCRDVEQIALTGIRTAHPGLDDVAIARELARRRYGEELAGAAYSNLR
jgi:hypothetical protein